MKKTNIGIGTSVGGFIFLTIIYGIVKYFMCDIEYPGNKSMSLMTLSIYILLAIGSQFVVNLTNSKSLCNGSPQILTTFLYTFVPNILIFLAIAICIMKFPGWKVAFSNTVGYLGLSIFKDLDWLKCLAKKDRDKNLIEKDNSLFLNEITPTNFKRVITNMVENNLINFDFTCEGGLCKSSSSAVNTPKNMIGGYRGKRKGRNVQKGGGLPVDHSDYREEQPVVREEQDKTVIDNTSDKQSSDLESSTDKKRDILNDFKMNENFQKLWKLVNIKSIISECIWFILCGSLVLAYSYNGILSASCVYSLSEQKKLDDKEEEKLLNDLNKEKNKKVHYT